jgi:50S ribosomal protein L16 3-hydroxylase
MIIEDLLGTIPLSSFMRDHFLKLPLAVAGGCRSFTSFATRETLDRIVSDPTADSIISRQGVRWEGCPSAGQVDQLLSEGYTIGIRRAQRHDPGLADLANRFCQDFQSKVDIHLYCTPASAPGFGWHYDAEDVFILQTQGSKEWSLRKNTVNPWPLVESLPQDMRYEREIMPLMRCALGTGDWLYIPAGYWHRTQAGEESISLSIGLLSPTGIDVFDFLRSRLLESLQWRCRLPTTGAASPLSADELHQAYCDRFRELGADLQRLLQDTRVVKEFLDTRSNESAQEKGIGTEVRKVREDEKSIIKPSNGLTGL